MNETPLSSGGAVGDSVALVSTFDYLDSGPFCMVVLEQRGEDDYFTATKINSAFARHVSPFFKMTASNFLSLVSEKHQSSFLDAIRTAKTGNEVKGKARNIEMTTLAESNSGLPIKRHFDWTVGLGKDGKIVLFGDPCTEKDMAERAQDAELIDFFQNAPIALHWLSGDGIVLWANQTELDVLGYTAEEYIGQPIMKFCPDEEELVLEIFKQLGSGNTIADVPVRFRTKDGRIVDLLIDSNVKYDEQGKFAHTRCFIRDDTKRKIREARAQLLLEETKRSLAMLDNFMSRSLHHMRTPLHILQSSLDIVLSQMKTIEQKVIDDSDLSELVGDCDFVLTQAQTHVSKATEMIDDISDLARFDQGQQAKVSNDLILLKELGTSVFEAVEIPPKIQVALEFEGGGPSFIHSDARFLKKVLSTLVDHEATVVAPENLTRTITLKIGHNADSCVFAVISADEGMLDHAGSMMVEPDVTSSGLPPIFQRYHQELLPEDMVDLEAAGNIRDRIESRVNSHRTNSIGLGLPLSYHLVRSLGGDLRYSTTPEITKFWFSIPHNNGRLESERIVFERPNLRRSLNDFLKPEESEKEAFRCTKAKVASDGLKAMVCPSILVVEDVAVCAKLLCTILRQFNCSTKWVQNGQEAVDALRQDPDLYSLVFMDLRMPVMDGITATRIIKNELKVKTPIVALTGEGGTEIRKECMDIGFDAYCNKPMKRDHLLTVIKEHTGYAHK
ncbi:cheY-homologous receiver domain [Fragilaria crotonensis]|nr:cheY-homologous receiver domain [Fragilaria crotonensis]